MWDGNHDHSNGTKLYLAGFDVGGCEVEIHYQIRPKVAQRLLLVMNECRLRNNLACSRVPVMEPSG